MGNTNMNYLLGCFKLYHIVYVYFILFWAHPIYVCGDDHVTCYMGADGDAGEHVDT